MEYRDLHFQHQLQEEYARYYKPSFTYDEEAWNSSNLCNSYGSTFTESSQSTEINLRDKEKREYDLDPQRSSGDDMLTKDEVSDHYLPRLSERISSRLSGSSVDDSLVSSTSEHYLHHVTGKETWPAGISLTNKTTSYNTLGAASSSSSSDLSTLEMPPSLLLSCSLGLGSQMLLGGSSCGGLHLSYDSFGLDDMQQPENSPSDSSNKISGFISGSGVEQARTIRGWPEQKEYEGRAKKSRSSCPALKVRKEKLGDRIQTLQRFVAPFGKTNTASVLNETIGYIHFLHDQIQTLSIPYMKPWKTKPFGTVQLDSREENGRESKPDLRSKGLCLVPLSCASYIHNLD
ncbi:transcription factor bHLH110-like isoform X2 [Neltuma alba]|uniref:transcription factor bHLH110-like isoform X2 n=1 Tax=Neltuma alba TaxID=207710 RepID=UPI0010A2BD80|nr:transcription factor bHLH110-like isoform X2 [Prosopis alba]